MDSLREKRKIPGIGVTAFKQGSSNILCKIILTPSDAIELCNRTKSGLFKNKEFHDRFINSIITKLDEIIKQEKDQLNASK